MWYVREHKRELVAIKELSHTTKEGLTAQGSSSKDKSKKTTEPPEPGRDPLDMETCRMESLIEQLSIKEMELGARKRELQRKAKEEARK
ncbi:hypothetical protein PWT90_06560 [Aphanocladium album]|nr:hypothetical protein PWT90_06560 [Aphanocladium album]